MFSFFCSTPPRADFVHVPPNAIHKPEDIYTRTSARRPARPALAEERLMPLSAAGHLSALAVVGAALGVATAVVGVLARVLR